jgi:7-cyano-7-deazaguanine synthase
MPKPGQPCVVLLSGGLDSATALAIARSKDARCFALSFDYGQRHRCELDAAAQVARALGAEEHLTVGLDLRAFGGSALTDDQIEVPRDRSTEAITGKRRRSAGNGDEHDGPERARPPRPPREPATDIPVTYVPGRNMVFLSVAIGWAEVLQAREVFIGVNAIDYSGYPDCRPEFIAAMERAAALGTRAGVEGAPITIRTPLIAMPKGAIIRRGVELGVDYSLTVSCYDPDEEGRACGRCDSCLLRAKGFKEAGVPDPTRYQPGVAAGAAREG